MLNILFTCDFLLLVETSPVKLCFYLPKILYRQIYHISCTFLCSTKVPHLFDYISGAKRVGINPKINNMMQGYEAAAYDHILISDCSVKSK